METCLSVFVIRDVLCTGGKEAKRFLANASEEEEISGEESEESNLNSV